MTEYTPGARIPEHLRTLIRLHGGTVATIPLVFPHGRYDKRFYDNARLGDCRLEYGPHGGQWLIGQVGKPTTFSESLSVEGAVLELIKRAT